MMTNDLAPILIACFGSICQELVHWYDIRGKLETSAYKKLLHSHAYWIVTVLMVVVSGIGTWLLYGQHSLPRHLYFLLGAAFPMIFKKLVKATETKEPRLGSSSLREYFYV